jgi:hypothetical protein
MQPPPEEKGRFQDGAFSLLRILGWTVVVTVAIVVLVAALLIIRVAVTGGN